MLSKPQAHDSHDFPQPRWNDSQYLLSPQCTANIWCGCQIFPATDVTPRFSGLGHLYFLRDSGNPYDPSRLPNCPHALRKYHDRALDSEGEFGPLPTVPRLRRWIWRISRRERRRSFCRKSLNLDGVRSGCYLASPPSETPR